MTYPNAATPLGRNDYSASRHSLAHGARRGLEFPMYLKHLHMTVSVLDTAWRSFYGARAFGTVVIAVGTFKGLINHG
jgi:ABC-type transporter Mla maintaining outer membrane lipid asymmetry permease subunit MlaE